MLVAVALGAAACQVTPGVGTAGGWDRNVSERGELWGAYRAQGVYRLDRDVLLLDVPERTNGRALASGLEWDLPPGTFRGPVDATAYAANPRGYRGVIGLVPAGIRVRAEILRAKGNLLDKNLTRHYVKGRILDGEYQGWLVDLEPLSLYRADPEGGSDRLAGPNDDFLSWVS